MTTASAPPVSKRPSELNDPKSLQIYRFGAMLIVHDDNNNKCAARFKASFRTKWFDIIANCTLQCHVSYILWKQQMRCPFESVLPKPMIPNDRKLVRCSVMLVIYYDSNKCVARLKASFWTKWFAIIANLPFWCHVNYLITMTITNAPPVSQRPSEPNDSHSSHNRILSAMLMIRNYRKLIISVQ